MAVLMDLVLTEYTRRSEQKLKWSGEMMMLLAFVGHDRSAFGRVDGQTLGAVVAGAVVALGLDWRRK